MINDGRKEHHSLQNEAGVDSHPNKNPLLIFLETLEKGDVNENPQLVYAALTEYGRLIHLDTETIFALSDWLLAHVQEENNREIILTEIIAIYMTQDDEEQDRVREACSKPWDGEFCFYSDYGEPEVVLRMWDRFVELYKKIKTSDRYTGMVQNVFEDAHHFGKIEEKYLKETLEAEKGGALPEVLETEFLDRFKLGVSKLVAVDPSSEQLSGLAQLQLIIKNITPIVLHVGSHSKLSILIGNGPNAPIIHGSHSKIMADYNFTGNDTSHLYNGLWIKDIYNKTYLLVRTFDNLIASLDESTALASLRDYEINEVRSIEQEDRGSGITEIGSARVVIEKN